ncbi:MAG: hypothetical protein AB2L14_11555 [Candidatus Xenobiia bacterium LiM19]
MSRLAVTLLLILLMAVMLTPAWAEKSVPADKQVSAPPSVEIPQKWSPVPGVEGVRYAPNQAHDIFQYGRNYYCFHNGQWYLSGNIQISWGQTQDVPQIFHQIPANCFKYPPGWARGGKTGWKKAALPPGQIKKYSK